MKALILGSGPMPCEPQYAAMAPGARTWQIAQTAAWTLPGETPGVAVVGLEPAPRSPQPAPVDLQVPGAPGSAAIRYLALGYDQFIRFGDAAAVRQAFGEEPPGCIVGCASLLPCFVAARLAADCQAPLWADIFGDPIAEIQSRAELNPDQKEANDTSYHHVWKLLLEVLLRGDRFSGLSGRQRQCLIGQLGVAGRLNRHTQGLDFVHDIPYSLFPGDRHDLAQVRGKKNFIVMWCGSFNTWTDVGLIASGMAETLRRAPNVRFLVAGGRIPNYNEAEYDRFVAAVASLGIEPYVKLTDWQPLAEVRKYYAACDVGLSVDRFTYEAVLGSRTRIVNFLASGRPVVSTVTTELTEELAARGFVLPFRAGDPQDFARAIAEAADRPDATADAGARGRQYVWERFDGLKTGAPLAAWMLDPQFAPDKGPDREIDPENPLAEFWKKTAL